MKRFTILLASFFCLTLSAQDFDAQIREAPYMLPAPEGWGVERFPIPIVFAPGIPYTGVEDIRFAPGWGKAKSEEYWSYAFLWYLDGKVRTNARVIASNLKMYYDGLVSANGSNIPGEKLIPVLTDFAKVKKTAGDLATFSGTVKMTNYMNQEPITLICKVHLKKCAGADNTFLFFELSPQPFTHDVWSALDQLWTSFSCTKD